MQPWIVVLALFSITSVIETVGISQILAFLPLDLRTMGLAPASIPRLVGMLNALTFVFGLPLVPLWGVLADRYSRKLVIVRSALVEALVFGLVASSRQPWELAGSLLLVGFQLGNTGVMLAMIRDVTPPARLGTAIALFGATSPVGFAVGPAIGGLLVDQWHAPIASMYALSSALSVGSALLLMLGLREVRARTAPTGAMLALAWAAIRGVLIDSTTRRMFAVFGAMLLARMMVWPFLPIVVERTVTGRAGLASAIALVVGTAALVGGAVSPIAGAIGDRVGFRPVLIGGLLGAGAALLALPSAPSISWLAVASGAVWACGAAVSAMVFALLASEVPTERRTATLNLVYLPLYLAGIAGPAAGAVLVGAGLHAVFYAAALVVGVAAISVYAASRRDGVPG